MKSTILQFTFLCLSCIALCQKREFSFTIQPYSTHLIDSKELQIILNSLEGFLDAHLNGIANNPYVDTSSLEINTQLFHWFTIDTSVYKPSLLSILPVIEGREYLVTVSYMGNTADKKPLLGITYSMTTKKRGEKYFFYSSIDYNTRNWSRNRIGTIEYIYPNKLNLPIAKKFDAFNKTLAKKFSTEVIPITYYKCDDPVQLFRILGCDYVPNMYLSTQGGLAEQNNTLFAGNNSEWYPHELVHFYTNKFPSYNRIVHEGYATFIGGSGGISLEELKVMAREFLKDKPNADLVKMFVDFERISRGIPFTYIASGLICREIEKKKGFSSIQELFKAEGEPEGYFSQLEKVTGVNKQKFAAFVRELIND